MKKIDLGRKLFSDNLSLARSDGKAFRKLVLESLISELNISVSAAASIYNVVKKEHESTGALAPGELGRDPAKIKRWGKKDRESSEAIVTGTIEASNEDQTQTIQAANDLIQS